MLRSRQVSLGGVIWLVVGVIVASSHHFLDHFQTVSQIGSAVLAVLVWPLVVLHVHIGI
jgi:ABC-type anion transport system duplicated permease subunit